ncbi:hypothetical protein GGR56DRAFT_529826 [Xylariaceae sp. FL0804]|nr:hypothetical protein GGR56DRAFT_529826 [Xylariaceae sp. FL0804]
MLFLWIWAASLLAEVLAILPAPREACPPLNKNGTMVVDQYQLYPENADFDQSDCLVYFGALFNASVAVYDPYKAEMVQSIDFTNITHNAAFHIGGVAWDQYTRNMISVLVDAAPAFNTAGQNISGDNYIMRYDATTQEVVWFINITQLSQGVYGGFQDVEHDSRGHVYVLGTYPSSLLRVEPDGSAIKDWYLPEHIDHTAAGYTGLAATGDILVVSDCNNNSARGGDLYRFDLKADKGTPVLIPRTPNTTIMGLDAIYMPPKYDGKVLLVAEHDRGMSVHRSADGKWKTAEYIGRVPNPPALNAAGAIVTAPLEVAGSLFMVEEWFADPIVPGTNAGNRTQFPLVDVTQQVEDMLAAKNGLGVSSPV